jgi:3-methyladenine DNA glycosylase AlkD
MTDTFKELRDAANAENAAQMAAYMKNQFEFLGVKSPERRAVSKDLLKTKPVDWALIQAHWEAPEREFQYVAADWLDKQKNGLTPEDLPRLSIGLTLIQERCSTIRVHLR